MDSKDTSTTSQPQEFAVEGGCHCQAVRFRILIDNFEALRCNCSICRMKGLVHCFVPEDKFTLLKGADKITTYTFNTHTAKHTFCSVCGICSFYRPRSHPDSYSVNVNCIDSPCRLKFKITKEFDGENWEKNIQALNPDFAAPQN